jgi:methylglutaconyl-CoA hydratase
VDYVSKEGQSAVDRALELADEMSSSGTLIECFVHGYILTRLHTLAPLALRAAKRALSLSPDVSLADGLDLERACYEPLLSTKDRTEALAAFSEKRKPIFKGE